MQQHKNSNEYQEASHPFINKVEDLLKSLQWKLQGFEEKEIQQPSDTEILDFLIGSYNEKIEKEKEYLSKLITIKTCNILIQYFEFYSEFDKSETICEYIEYLKQVRDKTLKEAVDDNSIEQINKNIIEAFKKHG